MIIYENRARDPIFEKLFETLSRDERNEIWEQVTGFVYEPIQILTAQEIIDGETECKKAFDEGIKEGLRSGTKNKR